MTEDHPDARPDQATDTAPHDAPPEEPVIDERYRLHEQLGEGGMGTVYRATHVLMDKPVAIKLIHGELAHIEEVVKRFEREARSASRLTDPHCITVTDFGRTGDGTLYLVMELLDGEPLSDRLERDGAVDPAEALRITRQILKGLEHAHEAGVVHRDLKPENVMLVTHGDESDFAKVFDFGIAKLAHGAGAAEDLTQSGLVVGTPGYLSPEQALGEGADHRADLYAVGVMLFEMLTGKPPFGGESAMDVLSAHLTAPVPPLPERLASSAELDRLIERAMAKKPAERFQTAGGFLAALEEIDPQAAVAAPAPGAEETPLARVIGSIRRTAITALAAGRDLVGRGLARYRELSPRNRRLTLAISAGAGVAILAGVVALVATSGETFESRADIDVVATPELDEKKAEKIEGLFAKADTQIRVGLPGEARVTVKKALRISPDQPFGHLLLGHALFLLGNKADAMKSYGRALALDKDLAVDVRLGAHLEEALSSAASRGRAARMLAEFGGDKGADLLAERAGSALSGGEEREAARKALLTAGKGDRIDWRASLTADFNEYQSCKKRKLIIAEMVKTKDPGFLPLLKGHLPRKSKKKKSVFSRSSKTRGGSSCLARDLKRAIETLSAYSPGQDEYP
jgi:serine/threonine-protein kinase